MQPSQRCNKENTQISTVPRCPVLAGAGAGARRSNRVKVYAATVPRQEKCDRMGVRGQNLALSAGA